LNARINVYDTVNFTELNWIQDVQFETMYTHSARSNTQVMQNRFKLKSLDLSYGSKGKSCIQVPELLSHSHHLRILCKVAITK